MARRLDMTEETMNAGLKQAAELVGCKFLHIRIPFLSSGGFPDCTILTPYTWLIELELKVTAEVTKKQREWLDMFGQVPGVLCAAVLRPKHYDAVLDAITNRNFHPGGIWQELNRLWEIESAEMQARGD